jgi:hypothetical protein
MTSIARWRPPRGLLAGLALIWLALVAVCPLAP